MATAIPARKIDIKDLITIEDSDSDAAGESDLSWLDESSLAREAKGHLRTSRPSLPAPGTLGLTTPDSMTPDPMIPGSMTSGLMTAASMPDSLTEQEEDIYGDRVECSNEQRASLQGESFCNMQLLDGPGGACYKP